MRCWPLVAILLIGCQAEPAPPVAQASMMEPAAVPEPERPRVSADPALLALAEQPDPDVRDLTPEEIRAELKRANAIEGEPAFRPIAATGSDATKKWSDIEQEKKDREAAYESLLARSVSFSPVDGRYHNGGCAALMMEERLLDGSFRTRYVGSAITVRAAKERGLSPHKDCGAPDYRRNVY